MNLSGEAIAHMATPFKIGDMTIKMYDDPEELLEAARKTSHRGKYQNDRRKALCSLAGEVRHHNYSEQREARAAAAAAAEGK